MFVWSSCGGLIRGYSFCLFMIIFIFWYYTPISIVWQLTRSSRPPDYNAEYLKEVCTYETPHYCPISSQASCKQRTNRGESPQFLKQAEIMNASKAQRHWFSQDHRTHTLAQASRYEWAMVSQIEKALIWDIVCSDNLCPIALPKNSLEDVRLGLI